MARFVLWGTYSPDALQKRTPFREEHLARLQSLKDDGVLITLGPTEGSTHVFGIFEADAVGTVRQLVEDDVYWKQGIWTGFEVILDPGVLSLFKDPSATMRSPFSECIAVTTICPMPLLAIAAMASAESRPRRSNVASLRFLPAG